MAIYMTGDGSTSMGKRGNRGRESERTQECETVYHLLGLCTLYRQKDVCIKIGD